MLVYAGIDEAGYGPLLGPLVVASTVWQLEGHPPVADGAEAPDLWQILHRSVCRQVRQATREGKIPFNDSKKLHGRSGQADFWLELGSLLMASCTLSPREVSCVKSWLSNCCGHDPDRQPVPRWYQPEDGIWPELPLQADPGQLAVLGNLLRHDMQRQKVAIAQAPSVRVVFEDQFNTMVANTRSKAALSFTLVGSHLWQIMADWGTHQPLVVVDRQSGRAHYRPMLAQLFPDARLSIVSESPSLSAYTITLADRAMHVCFPTRAEEQHLPVAAASMAAKYTREMMMGQMNQWFTRRIPSLQPTAGYHTDGERFLQAITPALPDLGITEQQLRRVR